MKAIVFFSVLLANYLVAHGSSRDYNFRRYDYFKQKVSSQCVQEMPSCAKCLQKNSCTWCSDNQQPTGVCKSSHQCPSSRQIACSESNLEDQLRNSYQLDRSYILDIKQVTLNASYLCHMNTNCSACTSLAFCAWCKTKQSCIAYSGSSTTESCGSESWYKQQCTYAGYTTPCPDRKPNCKDCLSDGICYWCDSTKECRFYPKDDFKPDNCSTDHLNYKSCSHIKEIIVLLPIISFILCPIIIYVVIYAVLWLMRKQGYEGLDDSDSSDDDDDDKKRRPIMLRHGSPGGKTDKLRKKYDLGKKP